MDTSSVARSAGRARAVGAALRALLEEGGSLAVEALAPEEAGTVRASARGVDATARQVRERGRVRGAAGSERRERELHRRQEGEDNQGTQGELEEGAHGDLLSVKHHLSRSRPVRKTNRHLGIVPPR